MKEIAEDFSSSVATIMKYMDEYEIPRSKAGSNRTKPAGLGLGYGQQNRNRQIIPNKRELQNIEKMKQLRDDGFSYWKIADIFNSMGIPTKTKRGRWHARSVQSILDRSTLANASLST